MFQIDTSTPGMPTKAAPTNGVAISRPPQDDGFAQVLTEFDLEAAAPTDKPSDEPADPDITDVESVAFKPDENLPDAIALPPQSVLPDNRLTVQSSSAASKAVAASIDAHKLDVSKGEQDQKVATDARGLALKTGDQVAESAPLPAVADPRRVSTSVAQRVAQVELYQITGTPPVASAAGTLQGSSPLQVNPSVAVTPGQNVGQPMPLFADESMQSASPLTEDSLVAALPSTTSSMTTASTSVLNRSYAPQVASQIATAVVQSSNGATEIALNPEELGRVRITLTTTEAGLSVAILAERPETADLMRRNLDMLAREFRELGHENLSFTFGDQSDGSDQQGNHGPQSGLETDANAMPDVASTSVTLALSGGLDLKL